jgi:hypothetical protein
MYIKKYIDILSTIYILSIFFLLYQPVTYIFFKPCVKQWAQDRPETEAPKASPKPRWDHGDPINLWGSKGIYEYHSYY